MSAKSIDEVLEKLDEIIRWSIDEGSPLGYFPALYKKVTKAVRDNIKEGFFDDNDRMEKLDVVFANRYLNAFENFQRRKTVTKSWQLAFEMSQSRKPIVLQHLLLGMNAHINLDLGIAAAEVSGSDPIEKLKDDFFKINEILGSLVDEVQRELSKIWPFFRLVDFIGGRLDENLAKFSMDLARDCAWQVAQDAARLSDEKLKECIQRVDESAHNFGEGIAKPGFVLGVAVAVIRISEIGSVKRKIRILS